MNMCLNCRLFLRIVLIFILTLYASLFIFVIPWYVAFILSAIPIFISFSTISSFAAAINLCIPLAVLSFFSSNQIALYLPIVAWALTVMSFRSGKKWTMWTTIFFVACCIFLGVKLSSGVTDAVLIISSLLTLIFALPSLRGKSEPVGNIDIIVSGDNDINIIAETFASSAAQTATGAIQIIDCYKDHINDTVSNAVVIAFQSRFFGCGRKFIAYIIKNLPKGNGKPAFILYTSNFYHDMPAFLVWIVLIFKGYTPKGKLFVYKGVLGEKLRESNFLQAEKNIIFESAGDFADGWYCGEPLNVLPSPLFALNIFKK